MYLLASRKCGCLPSYRRRDHEVKSLILIEGLPRDVLAAALEIGIFLDFTERGLSGEWDRCIALAVAKPGPLLYVTGPVGGWCWLRLGCVSRLDLPRRAIRRRVSIRMLGLRGATHNPKVVGSNPTPATTKPNTSPVFSRPSGLGWIVSRAPFVNPSSGNLR